MAPTVAPEQPHFFLVTKRERIACTGHVSVSVREGVVKAVGTHLDHQVEDMHKAVHVCPLPIELGEKSLQGEDHGPVVVTIVTDKAKHLALEGQSLPSVKTNDHKTYLDIYPINTWQASQ
jgi:hypothetical protein